MCKGPEAVKSLPLCAGKRVCSPVKGSMTGNEAGDVGKASNLILSASAANDSFAAREWPNQTGIWESSYVGMGQLGRWFPEELCTRHKCRVLQVRAKRKRSEEVQGVQKAFPGAWPWTQAS